MADTAAGTDKALRHLLGFIAGRELYKVMNNMTIGMDAVENIFGK